MPNLKSLSVSQNLLKRLPKAGRSFSKRSFYFFLQFNVSSDFFVDVWIEHLLPTKEGISIILPGAGIHEEPEKPEFGLEAESFTIYYVEKLQQE